MKSQSSTSQNGNSLFHHTLFGGNSNKQNNIPKRPTTSGTESTTNPSNSTFRRKASFSYSRGRNPSQPAIPNFTLSPPKRNEAAVPPSTLRTKPSLTLITTKNQARPRSANRPEEDYKEYASATASARPRIESWSSTAPYSNMIVAPYTRDNPSTWSGTTITNAAAYPQSARGGGPQSPTLETITYQHIQEMASKRISTLDYLRKAHEGRVYWFNTLLFNKPDLTRLPSLDSRKLARRSTNYLLLGLSLPPILDLSSNTALEFLRNLNALLAEFEAFQSIHPSDGSTTSSLSRARLPQMFKRAASSTAKGRRTSSATEIGLPSGNDGGLSAGGLNGSIAESTSTVASSFPAPMTTEQDLLPGEEYMHLLTPSLPFDPDFYETFATLCDVLIDCYQKLLSLVSGSGSGPGASGSNGSLTGGTVGPGEWALVGEMFTQADKRVRRIIVQGVVKEFEESSRTGVKSEVAGVGKVVLGGLI